LAAVIAPNEEAHDRPHRLVIHPGEHPRALEQREALARSHAAPANGPLAVEGEDARRGASLHQSLQRAARALALAPGELAP